MAVRHKPNLFQSGKALGLLLGLLLCSTLNRFVKDHSMGPTKCGPSTQVIFIYRMNYMEYRVGWGPAKYTVGGLYIQGVFGGFTVAVWFLQWFPVDYL